MDDLVIGTLQERRIDGHYRAQPAGGKPRGEGNGRLLGHPDIEIAIRETLRERPEASSVAHGGGDGDDPLVLLREAGEGFAEGVREGVAAGGLEIWRRLRGEPLRIATVAGAVALAGYGVLLTVSLYNYYFSPRFGKEQWREAVALVDSRATSSDLILLDPDYLRHGFNYYGRRSIATLPLTDPLLERTLSRDPEMMARLRQHDRIWLVRSHYQDDRLLNLLRETLAQQDRFVFPKGKGIEIHQFAVTALSNPQKLGPGQPH